MTETDRSPSARICLLSLVAALSLSLAGCDCDDCNQALTQKQSELQQCELQRDDYLQQKNACLDELNLQTTGSVLSYECQGSVTSVVDGGNARYITICDDESSVTVTEGAIVVPEGMLIVVPGGVPNTQPGNTTVVLPGGGNVVFPGGGGVVFPGGGNVVFPGGGNVVFPGGGNVVFAPGSGSSDNSTTVSEDITAYDVYVIENPETADIVTDDGALRLPGGNSTFRCVQDNTSFNQRLYALDHISGTEGYRISCMKQGTGAVESTLTTRM